MASKIGDVSLPSEWNAREYQRPLFNAILVQNKKRASLVWHRRAGKDSCAMNLLAVLSQLRTGLYWHMLPSFQQGRRVVWEGIMKDGRRMIDQCFPEPLRLSVNETNMAIRLKGGSIYQVVGSDNFDALVGSNPIGVVFSEYSVADPRAWDYIRPILAENGGWAIFIFTPRGKNHGKKLHDMARKNPEWFCETLTVDDTGAITKEIVEEERNAGMPEEMIRQEFYCDFTAQIVGSYYGDLMQRLHDEGQVTDFEVQIDGVNTHWDLGISDSTAIWFWRSDKDGNPEIIDYYEAAGMPISHYSKVLEARGYNYVRHWLPHDAQSRSLATGMSIMDQMRAEGLPVAISPKLSLIDGIQAARWTLMQPIKFHATNCAKGIAALEAYHREYDEFTKTFKQKPFHDWSSHGADAFRYLSLSIKAATSLSGGYETRRIEALKKAKETVIVLPTLDDMWKIHENSKVHRFGSARV